MKCGAAGLCASVPTTAAEITSGRSAGFLLAVPELVKWARGLAIQVEGKPGKVGDHMSPGEVESLLRAEAKRHGVRLLEHRSLTDKSGARSELAAIMENLGRIPTQLELGGDSAKLVLSIAGIAAYLAFLITVDVPMYLTRWRAEVANGSRPLSPLEGLRDASFRWVVTHDIAEWKDEIAWMSLYFSAAVWASLALCVCYYAYSAH